MDSRISLAVIEQSGLREGKEGAPRGAVPISRVSMVKLKFHLLIYSFEI